MAHAPVPSPPSHARTAWEAIDLAYQEYDRLPMALSFLVLPSSLTSIIDELLTKLRFSISKPHAVIAEKVRRVLDISRSPKNRVDFFVYCIDGQIVRLHPGHTAAMAMIPHTMSYTSFLFHKDTAIDMGVGAALYKAPPAMLQSLLMLTDASSSSSAAKPAELLCTRQDLDSICKYDINVHGWNRMLSFLDDLPDWDAEEDLSNGLEFPWWLWLGNMGRVRDIVGAGVHSFKVGCKNRQKYILVESTSGTWQIFVSLGKERKMLAYKV